MPCYSAANLRLAAEKIETPAKDRAKTAHALDPLNFYKTRNVPTSVRKTCDDIVMLKYHKKQEEIKAAKQKVSYREAAKRHFFKPVMKTKFTNLPVKEYNRLKSAAKVVTLEERLDNLIKQEQESKRHEKETVEVRARFKEIDDAHKRRAEANVEKEDLSGAGEKLKLLEKAFLAKHEQEEEVKRVNRLILDAKCHAVRDAQVQEKIEIERGLKNENVRLEKMVIDRALKSLEEEDDNFEKSREKKLQYAQEIKRQLSERDNMRFLEAERIEAESKIIRKACEALKRDEQRQRQLARERRLKFRDELKKIQEMSAIFKKMLCEQEKEAEMRVAAYMQEKREREKELSRLKQLEKEEMERKQKHLYTLAQKALESHHEHEEMSYIREQERIEREWRKKEREAAIKKRQLEKDLIESREHQIQETKHRQALQIARAEHDFNLLVERIKEDEEKQKKMDNQRSCIRKKYREDIIRQMGDKEMERRRLLELERNQAYAWRESERQRDTNIKAIISAKLKAMREACMPEKYVKDVEKQMSKVQKERFLR